MGYIVSALITLLLKSERKHSHMTNVSHKIESRVGFSFVSFRSRRTHILVVLYHAEKKCNLSVTINYEASTCLKKLAII